MYSPISPEKKSLSYSIDLREKIVDAYERGGTSIRKVAFQFGHAFIDLATIHLWVQRVLFVG